MSGSRSWLAAEASILCTPHFASLLEKGQLSPGFPPFLSAIYIHSVEELHMLSNLFVPQSFPSDVSKCVLFDVCVLCLCRWLTPPYVRPCTFSLPPAIGFACVIAFLVPPGSCVLSDFRVLLFCCLRLGSYVAVCWFRVCSP
jgi:hypothetical protein